MNACAAAHGKSTEAPVPLPEASATRVPMTTVAGDLSVLISIVYVDLKLLAIKLNFSTASLHICTPITAYPHLLLRSITHPPLCLQEHSVNQWML